MNIVQEIEGCKQTWRNLFEGMEKRPLCAIAIPLEINRTTETTIERPRPSWDILEQVFRN
jgi:hypothetical protein